MHSSLLAPLLAVCLVTAPRAQPQARLLRFPHIQGEKIAFVYGGDIWTASSHGGQARRITSFDQGFEIFPRISPDGRWIAFSAEYSGSRQIWLVPYEGGKPRQLTWYPDVGPMPPRGGYDHLPLDWTPDGSKILMRANRTPFGRRISRYFLVDPWNGGLPAELEIPEGGPATFSPDGSKLAYDIISREWRTWKRYHAGRAQDVWIWDLAGHRIRQITHYPGTDNTPLWLGNHIYYTSDRTTKLELWAHDLDTGKDRQITHSREFDVLFPARGKGGIIFQRGGWLWVMDAATEKVRKLEITLADDRPWARPTWKEGAKAVADFWVSPSAKRALIEFRGELFSAPAEKGPIRAITRTPHRRERQPRWSPDGKSMSYLAEAGEDYELFLRGFGVSAERQITHDTGAWILDHSWSPDAKRIAFTDKQNRLVSLDVSDGREKVLDRSREGAIREVSWSADSSWLTYVKDGANTFSSIWICRADGSGTSHRVSSPHYADASPSFDPKGRYLYFTSARDFVMDGLRFDRRIYALLLRGDVPSPLAPKSDEETTAKQDSKDEDQHEDKAAAEPLTIQLEGLFERLVVLPGKPGRYRSLRGLEDGLLFFSDGALRRYDLQSRKTEKVLDGASRFVLTPDHKQVLYSHEGGLCLAKVAPGQKAGKGALPLADLRVKVMPAVEWGQIYADAWRIMRDWFYDPHMHGVDWRAMREKYAPLIGHLAHRADLDFILGELVGELNCGHTYVFSGDMPRVARVGTGLLGCELEREGKRYAITKILDGQIWNERTRCPLREPGVDARVGDYLLAIDGEELVFPDNPYRLLEHKANKRVRLRLGRDPSGKGAREVVVKTVASEEGLRYLTWVNHNRHIVDKLSGGRIGYVHVPNTAVAGHRELFEHFRPQAAVKQAMIIDDRYNGGGFIPERMIQAIGMPVLNYWARRETNLSTSPTFAFPGPMAMLINGYSSSGGDAFPFYFRRLKRGKLIGKKTWGGLVGYSGSPRLVDGGGLSVPSFAFVNVKGQWDVEGVGVGPDIEVFDDPTLILAGHEPILEAAVKDLLAELKKRGAPSRPEPPTGPKRN